MHDVYEMEERREQKEVRLIVIIQFSTMFEKKNNTQCTSERERRKMKSEEVPVSSRKLLLPLGNLRMKMDKQGERS